MSLDESVHFGRGHTPVSARELRWWGWCDLGEDCFLSLSGTDAPGIGAVVVNTLVSVNVVALRRARLLLGWVTCLRTR